MLRQVVFGICSQLFFVNMSSVAVCYGLFTQVLLAVLPHPVMCALDVIITPSVSPQEKCNALNITTHPSDTPVEHTNNQEK